MEGERERERGRRKKIEHEARDKWGRAGSVWDLAETGRVHYHSESIGIYPFSLGVVESVYQYDFGVSLRQHNIPTRYTQVET